MNFRKIMPLNRLFLIFPTLQDIVCMMAKQPEFSITAGMRLMVLKALAHCKYSAKKTHLISVARSRLVLHMVYPLNPSPKAALRRSADTCMIGAFFKIRFMNPKLLNHKTDILIVIF